ncbi:MAG: prepilin peptidase [Candidatus Brocadiia bacterium]
MIYLHTARQVLLLALLVVAAYSDLAHGKVYNWSTYPAIVLGLLLAYVLDASEKTQVGLVESLLGLCLAGGLFGLFFLLGAFGAGDVKLAAAIGALSGWRFAVAAIAFSALAGGVMALGLLIWRGQLWRGLRDSAVASVKLRRPEKTLSPDSPARLTVPYGFAISLGTLWAWLAEYVVM